jgi:hypothetical protein
MGERMRRAAKIDGNQHAIVEALERCAVKVYSIGKPVDLLCCRQDKTLFLLEVKNPEGRDTITREQAEFLSTWPGDVHIVRSPEDAVRAVLGDEITRAEQRVMIADIDASKLPFHTPDECDCPGDEGSCARLANCRFRARA